MLVHLQPDLGVGQYREKHVESRKETCQMGLKIDEMVGHPGLFCRGGETTVIIYRCSLGPRWALAVPLAYEP